MSSYEYQALDHSRNQIRILKFSVSPKPDVQLVRCTLQHVSLDQLHPEYVKYVQEDKIRSDETEPFSPTEAARRWLMADHATLLLVRHQRWPIIDAWRYRVEFGIQRDTHEQLEDSTVPVPPRYEWGDFEAVSYCWETDVRDRKVLVDDSVVCVTANLEAMLRELQKLPEARSGMGFWIDGLCINQTDILEKNHQVALMRHIYSQALSTVVWLGAGNEESCQGVQMIRDLYRETLIFSADMFEAGSFRDVSLSHINGKRWRAVLNLWSRKYFKRMWIIQELTMNKTLSVFLCGNQHFTRAEMQTATSWAREHAGVIARAMSEDAGKSSLSQDIEHDYVWRTAYNISNLIMLSDTPPVDVLFDLARKAQVTDPRDKVYALLGLLPAWITAEIEPDYCKSKEEVYMELAMALLKDCVRLDEVLSWCVLSVQETLPSWVPDWTTAYERNHLQWLRKRKAGGEGPPVWSLRSHGRTLCCKGIKVDRIQSLSFPTSESIPYREVSLSRPPQDCDTPTTSRYEDRQQLILALDRTLLHDHPHRYDSGNLTDLPWISWSTAPPPDACKHVLELIPGVADQWKTFDRFRHTNAHFNIFNHPLHSLFPAPTSPTADIVHKPLDPSSITAFTMTYGAPEDQGSARPLRVNDIEHAYSNHHASNLRRAVVALHRRRLFTTQTGYLGLAPEEVCVGDSIAVLLGCNHPVVLRPGKEGLRYIGECYVHGLMDGEAVEAATRGECGVEDILIS